ncbi:sigma factor, partial [Nonomuraea rubra]|uniref:sigma factor n=1 Tax=Nonomuraea rubra TaxID=46180 RepID=UPI0036177741
MARTWIEEPDGEAGEPPPPLRGGEDREPAAARGGEERELVAAARGGDEEAFGRLVGPLRDELRAHCYRMLGSLSEAEDAVQEAWLRLARSDAADIGNLGGWLTTVVGRISLDMLRSRKSRREESLEERLPDPVVSQADAADPEREVLLADSVGLALLVVLESLTP